MTDMESTMTILEIVFLVAFTVVSSLCVLCLLGICLRCFIYCYEKFQIKMASNNTKVSPV